MRKTKAQRIVDQIDNLHVELENVQRRCKHLKVQKIAESADFGINEYEYWYNCFCPTCLKKWAEDR